MAESDVGGVYEVHASVLRSLGLCGGPLGVPASAGSGSRLAAKVFGSPVKGLGARPVALPFRQRAPFLFPSGCSSSTSVTQSNLGFLVRSHYNRHRPLVSQQQVLPIAYTGCPHLPVRTLAPNRLIVALLVSGIVLLSSQASAQDGDAPLGDVARSFRKKPAPAEAVIDNDNFSKVVDDA